MSWPSYLTFDLENLQAYVKNQTTYVDHACADWP